MRRAGWGPRYRGRARTSQRRQWSPRSQGPHRNGITQINDEWFVVMHPRSLTVNRSSLSVTIAAAVAVSTGAGAGAGPALDTANAGTYNGKSYPTHVGGSLSHFVFTHDPRWLSAPMA